MADILRVLFVIILSTPLLPVPLNPATNPSYRVYNVRIIANNIIHSASPLSPLPPPSLRMLYDTPILSRALTQSSHHPAFPQMDTLGLINTCCAPGLSFL